MPSVEALEFHYQDPAYFAGDSTGYRDYTAMHKALAPHFRRRLRTIRHTIGSAGRLLDFGCADGYFLELAQADGWQVAGVEIAHSMAESTRCRLGVEVAPSLEALSAMGFDAVTLWEVLEHLPTPVAGLARLRERLRPGGGLMLSTPNAGHWQAREEPGIWGGYRPPAHVVLFSAGSLAMALRAAGFERITVHGTMPLPRLPDWLRRASAPLERVLANGQARPWPLALALWRIVRLAGWGWQKLSRSQDDIYMTLEAWAFQPV
jgi:SAM-dependent methyltransferase